MCNHELKTYIVFTETYEYCVKCNLKATEISSKPMRNGASKITDNSVTSGIYNQSDDSSSFYKKGDTIVFANYNVTHIYEGIIMEVLDTVFSNRWYQVIYTDTLGDTSAMIPECNIIKLKD